MSQHSSILVAHGAYGRKASEQDWQAGKDFKIMDGPYFSIRDLEKLKADGYTKIAFMGTSGYVEFVKEVSV